MKAQNTTTNTPAAQKPAAAYEVSATTAAMVEVIRDLNELMSRLYDLVEADAVREIRKDSPMYDSAQATCEKRMDLIYEKSNALQEEIINLINRRTAETLRTEMPIDRQAPVKL